MKSKLLKDSIDFQQLDAQPTILNWLYWEYPCSCLLFKADLTFYPFVNMYIVVKGLHSCWHAFLDQSFRNSHGTNTVLHSSRFLACAKTLSNDGFISMQKNYWWEWSHQSKAHENVDVVLAVFNMFFDPSSTSYWNRDLLRIWNWNYYSIYKCSKGFIKE